MHRSFNLVIAACLILSVAVAGCGVKKAESSRAAIDESKALATTQEKVDFLVGQAKAFYNSKQFQDAVDIAQYILRYLDKDSPQAKQLLENAKEQLTQAAQSALQEAQKGFAK